MNLVCKITNGLTPNYLTDISPQLLENDIIASRTELFSNALIPSAVVLWNELPHDLNILYHIYL